MATSGSDGQLAGRLWDVKLELAPSDSPQHRASNGQFRVEVGDLVAELPVVCEGALRLRVRRGRRKRLVGVRVRANGRLVRRVARRALRGRTVLLRDLPAGTVRVRMRVRVQSRGVANAR